MSVDNSRFDHLYLCKKCKDQNVVKPCECGTCNEIIFVRDNHRRKRRFAHNHHNFRENHWDWKNGISYSRNYRYILIPDYPRAQKDGYVAEHIYVYQEYYKVCLLPWAEVHHKDPVRKGWCLNLPFNLIGVMKSEHRTLDRTKNLDDNICIKCGSNETYKKSNGRPMWYYDEQDNPICAACYGKARHVKKDRKKKDYSGIVCYLCGADNTTGLSRHGNPRWDHLNEDKNKPVCNKCYKKEYRKNKKNKPLPK